MRILRLNLALLKTADDASPQPDFDRIAAIYRLAEYLNLGPLLQRTRTALLGQLHDPRHALVLGDGDGRFLEQLLLRYPACRALAVDTSAAMLTRLRRRALRSVPNAADRLTTLQRTALELNATHLPERPDLIVTHFFLDCLTQPEVETLAARLADRLTPGGLWLVSDFTLPPHRFLRPLTRLYIRSLYLAFRLLTGLRVTRLPDPQSTLARAGLRRIARRTFLFGVLYTELWQRGVSNSPEDVEQSRSRSSHFPAKKTAFDALSICKVSGEML